MSIRSHFTTEFSSIKQTEKHQENIHVENTHMHGHSGPEKNIQMGISRMIHVVTQTVLFLASYSLC